MSRRIIAILGIGLASTTVAATPMSTEAADRHALQQTSVAIRNAFAEGDVKAIMSYHHPDVEKSFGPDSRVVGIAAVASGAAGTLRTFSLRFVENNVESLAVRGDTAIEVTRFVIQGAPRGEGKPFTFRGAHASGLCPLRC